VIPVTGSAEGFIGGSGEAFAGTLIAGRTIADAVAAADEGAASDFYCHVQRAKYLFTRGGKPVGSIVNKNTECIGFA